MTDNAQIEQNQIDQPVVETQETPKATERMFTQAEVSKIAAKEAREAAERARRNTLAEMEAKTTQNYAQTQQTQQMQQMGGMTQMSPDQIKQMIAEAAQSHVAEQAKLMTAHKIFNEFTSKMKGGTEKYPDFDQTVSELRLDKNPKLVMLANGADNTADVMYDLGKNPHKVGTLLALASNPNTEHLAMVELQRLSKSIKDNEAAKAIPEANDPLSQLKPSTLGTDSGKMTVKDYRTQDWLRA